MYKETQEFVRRVWKLSALYVGVLVASSVIFAQMEGWSFFEALYQIVITVSTVGFAEINEVSQLGRAYLMDIIVFQTGFFVYVASQLAYLIAEGKLVEILRYRRLIKMLEKMRDHTVVVGLGRTGLAIAETLQSFGERIVVIESDEERIKHFKEVFPHVPVIEGDAKEEEVLELAKVREARRLLVNTSSDSENMFIVVTARSMNPDIFISSRAVKPENEEKLRKAGANHTYTPESMSGRSIAISVIKPDVSSFIADVLLSEKAPFMLDSVEVPEGSPVSGRTLGEFYNEEVFGTLLAVVREGHFIINPPRKTKLLAGDRLIVLGSLEQIENLLSTVGS
ncbi:potassium channel protein [Hydrogenivirga sp. 128-5-R1-1]|uniref:potassium channel family protein n=1 Tax=Hydrogenivirga sp. 128-5-R1-1 TaxID=392423 RepID=UPI00015F161F|nr:potassium channel protein [Hydrogenivirga sp. 128-5-R1-1]EDP74785.1 potassium channel, putative [Hydrogenivirga sp. 128-5-R1-1]